MKWSQVEAGQTIRVKGEPWKVVAREGDSITMLHDALGEKTGTPPPDGEVELIPEQKKKTPYNPREGKSPEELKRYEDALKATEKTKDYDLEKLQRYAQKQGLKRQVIVKMDKAELREYITQEHAKRVAEDNGVTERHVQDVHLRLILGATLIAELHEGSELPQVTEVDKMDRQTMANHLHFFHDTYPAASVPMDELVTVHQASHDEDKETELHSHSVPF